MKNGGRKTNMGARVMAALLAGIMAFAVIAGMLLYLTHK